MIFLKSEKITDVSHGVSGERVKQKSLLFTLHELSPLQHFSEARHYLFTAVCWILLSLHRSAVVIASDGVIETTTDNTRKSSQKHF